jgi:DNA polymerase
MHQTPKRFEIDACRPWLDEELRQVKPAGLIILGATAGKALLGASFRIRKQRGRPIDSALAPMVGATVHPSAILRAPDEERDAERRAFAEDLSTFAAALSARRG